jgi:hypothetical protein
MKFVKTLAMTEQRADKNNSCDVAINNGIATKQIF